MNEKQGHILVVDDEENIREILASVLTSLDSNCATASHAEEALELLKEENFDVVVSDIRMPGMDGIEFLKKVKEEQPEVSVCMITAHGNYELVKQALRYGADDFLDKPFDPILMKDTVQRLLETTQNHNTPFPEKVEEHAEINDKGVIGNSSSFLQSKQILLRVAKTDSSVLLLGESGTGKEVMSHFVHNNSLRSKGSFIPVNCGAIPDNLMESELFGYEKGAFTGAMSAKPGRMELADGGTLFLDEVGELPLALQVKLLRVLQEKEVQRVGGTSPHKVDFRLVAATNRDLEKDVADGLFREDLYYRLNVVPVRLPPLKERVEDIVLLAEYFLKQYNQRYGFELQLQESDVHILNSYDWPGNIRELQNRVERALVLSDGACLYWDFPDVAKKAKPVDVKAAKQNAEKEAIVDALNKNQWNKTKTAVFLGMSRRSLLYKVKAYSILKES